MSRKKHQAHDEHPDERWLLTYADLITLLMALFIVMFAISSVNQGKFEELAKSLSTAFGGKTGGEAIKETGGTPGVEMPANNPPAPSLQAALNPQNPGQARDAQEEQASLTELAIKITREARAAGIGKKVTATVAPDGLTVRINTDGVFFDSGAAVVKPAARPLLARVATVFRIDGRHAIAVTGHTDSRPINSGQYPSNWELSTARASAVVRVLAGDGVAPARMTATGRASYDPVGSNATERGRAENRRVELFVPRMHAVSGSDESS